jgi:hypothetical protein
MDKDQREKFDQSLMPAAVLLVTMESGNRVRAPSWFKGADVAAQSSIMAARQFGFHVPEDV